jgi:5-methylcytosine-specific restriction endonuclease McrA
MKSQYNIFCSENCAKKYHSIREASNNSNYFEIFNRDKFTCVYCGRSSIENGIQLTIDHINPKKNGGIGCATNLITACSECNQHKSASILEDDVIDRIINRSIK